VGSVEELRIDSGKEGFMAASQSFDITTGCDLQEVDNAVNQAMKEVRQRFDFKGLKVNIDFQRAENKLVLHAPDEFKLAALWEVAQQKMVRRKVPIQNLHLGKITPAGGSTVIQEVDLQQGLPIETARAIVKYIKEQKIKKMQSEIQGDQVRVSSPSRDDLQQVISLLRGKDYGVELNFGNFRSM
jgi:uncharacterized protein YajQ (UPF0234 family)